MPPMTAPAPESTDIDSAVPVEAAATVAPARAKKARSAEPTRPTRDVLERLFQLYPKMFGARFLPLKLGVFQELMQLHPDEFKKDDLKLALGQHARSTRYLESVANGEKRHDLNGVPVEDVAPEHVHHAIMEVFRRRQARAKEDLRPWLVTRMAKAIEASGLSREDYSLRVPTPDPVAAAALDEAFGLLGERKAKNEALRRAFEASGRSVEDFAEMYGMELAQVRRALGPQS
jgi:ProP effector